jgi:cysteinyl-tRNA synthetase
MRLSSHIVTSFVVYPFVSLSSVQSFFLWSCPILTCRRAAPLTTTTATRLASDDASGTNASKGDEYDDFYNDFNPADFEQYNSDSRAYNPPNKRAYNPPNNRAYNPIGRETQNDYTRDLDADDSNVDVDAINALLAERTEKRKIGQFADADRIRDQLLDDYGVLCRDKDRTWRSGCSSSGSGQNWVSAGSNSKFRSDPMMGENGHDYNLSDDAGPNSSTMTDVEIHQLLAERLSYKVRREYRRADDIQGKLMSAGVFVSDSKKEWRADGKAFSSFPPSRYEVSPQSDDVDDATMGIIKALVADRAVAKVERLYKRADQIRDELLNKYNVVVDDRSLTFSVGGELRGEKRPGKVFAAYKMSSRTVPPSDVDEIQKMVEQRDVARVGRDFKKADEIRDALAERSILIDDKTREWYVGSDDYGERRGPTQRFEREQSPFACRGGGADLSDEDFDFVVESINKRDSFKQKRQYDQADVIRDELADMYGVRIDDRKREWRVDRSYTQ